MLPCILGILNLILNYFPRKAADNFGKRYALVVINVILCKIGTVLFVSGTPLVCIRSQRRVLGFEVRTPRLYPSQVQVYPGKYHRNFTLLFYYIMIQCIHLLTLSQLLTRYIGQKY